MQININKLICEVTLQVTSWLYILIKTIIIMLPFGDKKEDTVFDADLVSVRIGIGLGMTGRFSSNLHGYIIGFFWLEDICFH